MTQGRTPPAPSGLPLVGHAASFASDPFGFIERSVESTGDAFRMRFPGRDVYVLAHPDHIETSLTNREAFAKLDDFQVAFGDALLAVEGDQWRRQRHAMEPFFSPTRIHEYAETMVDITADRVHGWPPGETVRIDEEMKSLALHNLFEVVLGQSLSEAEADDLAETAYALNLWFEPATWALPNWVPTPARRGFHRGEKELRDRARRILENSGGGDGEDSLLARLAVLRDDPDSGFDETEVLDQVVGMIFAGHETTALAMTYALHQLAAHPDVAARFHAELDEVVDGSPTLAELQDMEYLDRIIHETLRLYPPVHAIPRVMREPAEVGDYVVPEGSDVLLSVWNVHHDSRFYDDPWTFDPDRWADTTPRARGYAYVPFGAGPRICIGRHFARLEMKAVLATVGQRYSLDVDDDAVEVDPQMTLQPAEPVLARVERREE
ncbi:cytochrome P450 [Haloarchaeobius sp. TZWSO28]|uniref:cytochrome P450 n=1 Tax=Haloarchaeobius sp. TZWSO28 TaxID=3446119 RepID=UPI003EBB3251